jgi:tetratricopeptide (TPR) repeat protein
MNLLAILVLPAALALGGQAEGSVDTTKQGHPDIRGVWDFNDPAASRDRFEKLLGKFDGAGDVSFRLELKTQVARAYALEGDFASAHAVLDEVEQTLEGAPPVVRIRYLLERGRAFNSSGKPDTARALFLEAWELGKEVGEHGLAVDAAHMMAIVEKGPSSLEWNERAIAYAEETQDPKAMDWLGSLYNNTGWSHHDLGNYERALELWRKALDWQHEHNPGSDRERIARYMVGRGLRSLDRCDEALEVQRALLADIEAGGHTQDGYVFEEIGECLLALGRGDEAAPWFGRAWEALSKDDWLAKNEPERLARMKQLAGR